MTNLLTVSSCSRAQVIRERRPSGVDVLMVAGEKDELVPPSKTLALSECFDPDFCEVSATVCIGSGHGGACERGRV